MDDVKYDPALSPLPAGARAALETVERERAYARFRLAMLDDPPSPPAPRAEPVTGLVE